MAGEPPDLIRMESHRNIDWNMADYSFQGSSSDKLSWVLEKGSSIGKKILVTGFVLSSAPVVLPPLVVISAFGFAVSIPYGIFLASFACTEKVMSMLLPNPPPTPLEYESEIIEAAYLDDNMMERKDVGEEFEHGDDMVKMARKDVEEEFERGTEMVEANGYEDGILAKAIIDGSKGAGVQDEEDEHVMEESRIGTEIQGTPIEVTTVYFEENGGQERVSDIGDEEELLKETKGLLEKIKDEGRDNDILEANEKRSQEDMSKPLDNVYGDVQLKKCLVVVDGRGVDKDNEVIRELEIVTEDVKPIGENGDSTRNTFGMGNQIQKPSDSLEIGIKERDHQEPADRSESLIDDRKQDDGYSYFKDDGASVSRKPEESKEVELSSLIVIDVTDSADLSVSAIAIDTHAGVNDADSKELQSEEKIREQIDSVKKIVGYKDTPHETWREELNALYTFVGVEAPSSLTDPSDLNVVNQKVQFLMSIVGVK